MKRENIKMTFQTKYIDNQEYLQHKAKYGAPISVRLNDEESKMVFDTKETLLIGESSTALKELATLGYIVLQGGNIGEWMSAFLKKKQQNVRGYNKKASTK